MKAMILAAGLGTRLKPFTDHHPKALALVNGKTLLQRNIEYLKSYGVDSFIINVHHFAEQIIQYLQKHNFFDTQIEISDERNEILETGGGLLKASWFFDKDEPFILMNADMLTDIDMLEMYTYHKLRKPLATLAVCKRNSSRCLLFNQENILCGWQNTSTEEIKMSRDENNLQSFSFSGIHIIEPGIFSQIRFTGKFSMIDVYLELAKINNIIAFDHSGKKLLDVGKPESIVEAEKLFF
ncbi:MAG: nucleotidyltransferase family protein [Bacteroidetes bacterium]|nr:nucleotidyltransferase family protein [Bacteroidota bacterium]